MGRWTLLAVTLITRISGATVHATTLESAFAVRLTHARAAGDVARVRAEYDRARVATLRCAVQTARGLAPLACYRALTIAETWGIRAKKDGATERRRLDLACADAAARLRVPAGDQDLAAVTAECRTRVREAQGTARYRDDDGIWSGD